MFRGGPGHLHTQIGPSHPGGLTYPHPPNFPPLFDVTSVDAWNGGGAGPLWLLT